MGLSVIFPGQGSQSVGMGKALWDEFSVAREVFEEVDDVLGEKLSAIIFEGPAESLGLTVNTQPALMAVSIACFRVLEKEAGLSTSNLQSVAGHSLGEYSALCAAGAFSLADSARLLRLRGEAMQQAVPVGEGGMAAILNLDMEALENLCQKAAELSGGVCEIANDNAPGQIVISGTAKAIEASLDIAKEMGAKRALPLPVSAPFHSSLMAPAAERMAEALEGTTIHPLQTKLFANVSAAPIASADDIRASLVAQITGRVRWRETISAMVGDGSEKFIECGAGKVLSGLVRRIAKEVPCQSVSDPQAVADLSR